MTADDHTLAAELAVRAGQQLLDLRASFDRPDADALRAEGDRSSHELLMAELGKYREGDAVLSEHGSVGSSHDSGGRVWIVDPLDGTREFGEPGRQDWAVHVALAERGRLVAGAVALPAKDTVLSTAEAPRRPDTTDDAVRLAVSRSRPPKFVETLATELDAEAVPMGSAGAKIAAVIRGEVDAYVHAGGQYEWDSAAPVAVAQATGLHTSRIDGSDLSYNRPDSWLPDLVVCRADLAERMRTALTRSVPELPA